MDLAWQLQLLQLQPNATLTLRNLHFRSAFLLQDLYPAAADMHLPGARIVQENVTYSTTCSALHRFMCVSPMRVDAWMRRRFETWARWNCASARACTGAGELVCDN